MKMLALLLLCFATVCNAHEQEIKPFVRGSYHSILAARAGQPFIVSLWSIDCVPCREDMHLFGRLANKYRDLELVLIATDMPQQKPQLVRALQHYQLQRYESWVFADSYAERIRFEVDPQWYGELPRTYFYAADGQVLALSGKLDQAQIERWINTHNK